LAFETLPDLLD
jgi:hypothetical protein